MHTGKPWGCHTVIDCQMYSEDRYLRGACVDAAYEHGPNWPEMLGRRILGITARTGSDLGNAHLLSVPHVCYAVAGPSAARPPVGADEEFDRRGPSAVGPRSRIQATRRSLSAGMKPFANSCRYTASNGRRNGLMNGYLDRDDCGHPPSTVWCGFRQVRGCDVGELARLISVEERQAELGIRRARQRPRQDPPAGTVRSRFRIQDLPCTGM